MSRYVLVEFEDDDAAYAFVEKTDAQSLKGSAYRIAGIFQRPNAWCSCPFQIDGVNRPVSRGKKFGWWICGWCKKPRPGTHQLQNTTGIRINTDAFGNRKFSYGVDHISIHELPNLGWNK